jgi:hypothetical protein
MSGQDPKSVVQQYYEEVANQRKLDVADEIIAPSFKLFPDSEPPFGPEGVKQFLTWLIIDTFSDMQVTIEDLIAEGEMLQQE